MLASKKSFWACTNQWASLKRTHSLDPKGSVPQAKEVEYSVENISPTYKTDSFINKNGEGGCIIKI